MTDIRYFDFVRIAGLNVTQSAILKSEFEKKLCCVNEWNNLCKAKEIYTKTPYHVKQIITDASKTERAISKKK